MRSMTRTAGLVTGGVDTHGRSHHAAVLDEVGRQLGDREFPTTPMGYRRCWRGCVATASSSASVWKAPARSEPRGRESYETLACGSSRSTVPIASLGGPRASLTR